VLEYVAFVKPTLTRMERVLATAPVLNKALTPNQEEFIHFVLDRYVATGVEELDDERLRTLIKIEIQSAKGRYCSTRWSECSASGIHRVAAGSLSNGLGGCLPVRGVHQRGLRRS